MKSRSHLSKTPIACALALLAAALPASAGSGRFKNGAYEFCVSVRFAATPAELQQIRDAFQNASQILSDATDGQHTFGLVMLVNDSGASQSAEYWIHAGGGRAYATQGNYGVRGQHVNLYFDDDFQGVNGVDGDAYTIAHEHAHHAYGILDEYSGPGGNADCAPPGSPDPADLSFCLMDNYYLRGGNATGSTYTLNEFCTNTNHDPDFDTFQEDVNARSCWDQIANHRLRPATAPLTLPNGTPPAPHTVAFEDRAGDLRVVLLIDRSGSMLLQQRIEFAKASASLFVDFIEDGDSLAVVSFAQSPQTHFPLTQITTQKQRDNAKKAIDHIHPSGATDMGAGLQRALDLITTQPQRSCNEVIVLLSDGEHTTGTARTVVLPQIVNEGVTVLSIGLGESITTQGELELQNIATQTGGKYFRVQSSFELVGLFTALSAEASGNGLLTEKPLNIPTGGFQSVGNSLEPLAKSASFVIGIKDPNDVITYTLTDPNGVEIDPALAASLPDVEFLQTPNSQTYIVTGPLQGDWSQNVTGVNITTGIFEALAFVGNDGINLNVSADKDQLVFPEVASLRAELLYQGQRVLDGAVSGIATRPDGSTVPVTFFDDGSVASGDPVADDGIYSTFFGAFIQDGTYLIDLVGESFDGVSTTFGGETHFPNVPPTFLPAPGFTRLGSLSLVITNVGTAIYCTAKTNSCGTIPMIGFTGTPSATATSGFVIDAINAPGPRPNGVPQNAELLYSLSGAQVREFKGGVLCLANQVRRTYVHPNLGGTIENCDATMQFDMNQFAHFGPGNPDPALTIPGNQVWVQWWGRDKPAGTVFLSDAVTYIIQP